VDLEARAYNGNTNIGGYTTGSGWRLTPGTDTNALTNYNYFDSWRISEFQVNPSDYFQTYSNLGNLRLKSSLSTNTTGGITRDWDFAMMSIRYLTSTPVVSVTVSDGAVAYGAMALSSFSSTSTLTDTQTITNNGDVYEVFNVKGTNTSCPWTLSGSIGTDQYSHSFCKATDVSCSSPPTNYTYLTTSYQSMYPNVTAGGTKNMDLMVTLPSSTSCYTQQSVDVTIQAVEY
jgi:hypothetical protein